MREKVVLELRSLSDPAKSIWESYKAPVTQGGQRCSMVGILPVASLFLCSEPPSWGQAACFGRGCASPAVPVLSPLLLLPATQLRVSSWAAAELVPDISNGPIMPDVFTAFGRK